MELSWRLLSKKSSKRYGTSPSRTSESVWTDTVKYTPPTPDPTVGEADDCEPRDYDLPIPSRKAIPDDYECDDNKEEKYKGRGYIGRKGWITKHTT